MFFRPAISVGLMGLILIVFTVAPALGETWVLKENLMTRIDEPNTFFECFYNENCNRIRESTDYQNDGSIDIMSYMLYNDLQQQIEKRVDNEADGSIEYVILFSYDQKGNNIKVEHDVDNDGTIEFVRYQSFDSAGNMVRMEEDQGNDGTIDSVTVYEYNEKGDISKTKFDKDNDGSFETISITEYTYYPDGNVKTAKSSSLKGGAEESLTCYYYESEYHDNPTEITLDVENDGSVDQTHEMTYEKCDCPPTPDIIVNGSDGPITVNPSETVSITVQLLPGTYAGDNSDWWLLASTPFGWYHYDVAGSSWARGFRVTHQGPIFSLNTLEVLNGSLPAGTYTFYFGVDMVMDSSPDMDQIHYDSVEVSVE